MTDLMDDLAMGIHEYLLEIATPYQESNFVLIPILYLNLAENL